MKNFKFDEGEVLLVRQNSKISAIGSKCTHYGAPLVKGVLGADGTVRCPWHGACFNSTSGEKLIFLTCSYNFLILMLPKIYLLLLIGKLFHHAMRLALYIFVHQVTLKIFLVWTVYHAILCLLEMQKKKAKGGPSQSGPRNHNCSLTRE